MARNLGDRAVGSTIDFKFNTHDTDGAPITLAGTPALTCYKNNDTAEDSDGITLTTDFDSRTGMHHVRVDTSADGTFYAAGNAFQVVITTGTVDGVSVVGTVIAEFTLGIGVNVTHWKGVTPNDLESSADVADAILDEALSGHVTAGTVGERMSRIPNAAPGGNGGLPTVDASNRVAGIQGTITTLDALDTAQDAQHATTQGALSTVSSNVTSILQDTDEIGVAGAGLTAVPWNSAWASNVQTQCANALNAYDPPTKAEMDARTLAAANYATTTDLATVDAVVDGIKLKTDQLTFTKAGEVDASLRSIRSYGVTGDGTENNKFGVQS